MFGVDIECDRSKGNVYYVKNPKVLEEKELAKWLLRNYSIPQDFVTFNAMKDRILLEEIPLGTAFLPSFDVPLPRQERTLCHQCSKPQLDIEPNQSLPRKIHSGLFPQYSLLFRETVQLKRQKIGRPFVGGHVLKV